MTITREDLERCEKPITRLFPNHFKHMFILDELAELAGGWESLRLWYGDDNWVWNGTLPPDDDRFWKRVNGGVAPSTDAEKQKKLKEVVSQIEKRFRSQSAEICERKGEVPI